MIKKDFRYIIRRVIVALLIAFILSFLKSNKVLAATTVQNYHYRLTYAAANCINTTINGYQCPPLTNTQATTLYQTNYTSFGTSTQGNIKSNGIAIKEMWVRMDTGSNTSSYFTPGNIYSLKFTINLAPRNNNILYYLRYFVIQTFDGSNYVSGYSEIYSCTATIPDNNNYATNVTCDFSVSQNARYVLIKFIDQSYPEDVLFRDQSPQGINFINATLNFTTDATVNAINNQTAAISQAISGIYDLLVDGSGDSITEEINQKLSDINSMMTTIIETAIYAFNPTDRELTDWKSSSSTGQASGSGINGLLQFPITLINGYLDGFGSNTCQTVTLGNLYGTNLTLPCFDPSVKLGAIWNLIDLLFSTFMIYNIARRFIQLFNKLTSLDDKQVDDLYGGGV